MAIIKDKKSNVESFNFGQLVPDDFKGDGELTNFELKSLNSAQDFKHSITDEGIRQEREHEAATAFEISPVIKEHRGLNKQAAKDYEERVSAEVHKRIEALKVEAYEDGLKKGHDEGQAQAYQEAKEELEAKVSDFAEQVENVQLSVADILIKSKEDAFLMVKNLSKWVILKEVDEKYYLVRLLEKLVHEINSKTNLVIHVNEDSFGYMPEIVKVVERKVGKLTNVRVEVDLDMSENGIKLESENNIIDGSLSAQFKSIDKLFHNVGVNE